MDLSRNKKGRKKVIIHTRKLSSTNNRSQRSFLNSTATAKYKQRINTLLKNNKVLALSLEDARCELSNKQKLLDDLYQRLNNMMFAHFRMLEMQSILKSFTKNFDEVLLSLKMDDSKCSDVGVPSQSSKYWKNTMEKIVESVEIHSGSVQDEMVDVVHKTVRNTPHQISDAPKVSAEEVHDGIEKNCFNMNVNASGTQVIPMNAPDKVNDNFGLNGKKIDDEDTTIVFYNELSNPIENPTSSSNQATSVLPSKDCEGMMSLKTASKESSVSSEDSGTPKLSISPKTVDAETFSGLKANSFNKHSSSSNKSNSEVLKNSAGVKPPVKIQCSKIPKMQAPLFKKKMKNNSSGVINKKNLTKEKFAIGGKESNLNSHQSKELIIEDQRKSEHEPVVLDKISNPEIFSEENIEESNKTANCRKTFVIKPSASENTQNSPSNRRKTFVINSNLPNNSENILGDKNIEVCCNKPLTESPKLLLESPLSECESIPELDLAPVENPLLLEKTPIRRQISKTKKVFVFDIYEKCIPNKTLGDCVQESSDFVQESTAFCQLNVDSASNEVKEYQDIENHKEKNKKKKSARGHSEDNIIDNISSDSVVKKKALVKICATKEKVKNKIKQKYKCAETVIKDCITSPAVSNCFGDKEPNEIQECIRKDEASSVPVSNKNETLSDGKRMNGSSKNENNMNLKCHNDDGKLDALFEVVKKRGRCRETNTYAKQVESMDDDIDDIISPSKKSKRTNPKKKLIENIKNVTNNNAIDDIISIPKRNKRNNSGKKTTENSCLDKKVQKCPKKAKKKVKTSAMLPNTPEKNTFLVQADVHPVPPSYMPETDILNKENEEIQELQVSVVLNDIMKSEKNNTLNLYRKNAVLHESKNSPLKTVLSDNSSNIPLPVDDTQKDYRNSIDAKSNSEDVCKVYSMDRRSRRRSNINYKEMSLAKKLRR